MRSVLFESAIAHLHKSKLALDHPKRILDFGTHTGLEFLCLVRHGISRVVFVERFALSWAHGYMPGDIGLGIRTLFNSLVAGITKGHCLLSVQQRVSFCDITDR